jgi:hypothetical protein
MDEKTTRPSTGKEKWFCVGDDQWIIHIYKLLQEMDTSIPLWIIPYKR